MSLGSWELTASNLPPTILLVTLTPLSAQKRISN